MRDIQPELLAPAGSFMAAYYAFEAGADAVYVGLRRFSARGSAQNFTPPEIAKLKALAVDRSKKIYVTLNTVIREDETDDLVTALADCERIGVDGVIVQDAGVLTIVRDHFPGLTIHASTQMAVGNAAGVREAVRLGIRRVVLPRETPFETVVALRRQFPDMEFEVFIHGALCYSYSGFCLASGLMGGGSGNRGACAQVCRLRFTYHGREQALLSCRDLFSGPEVRRLGEAGVDSLKIEGRLKPASYVYHTVRLYRFILDHDRPEDEPEYADLLAHSGFVFSRERTRGRLFGGPDERLITLRYERSVGFPAGRVETTSAGSFSFTARVPVAAGDVLQVFLTASEKTPYKLPVRNLYCNGLPVPRAERGDFVTVESGKIPDQGQDISKVYARNQELPGIRHRHFQPRGRPLPLNITLSRDAPSTIRFAATDGRIPSFSHTCTLDKEEQLDNFRSRLGRAISQLTVPFFRPALESLQAEGPPSIPERVIGNRQLKIILDAFARHVSAWEAARIREICAGVHQANRSAAGRRTFPAIDRLQCFLADRTQLNPLIPPDGIIPFYAGGQLTEDSLACRGNSVFIPLHPLVGDDDHNYYSRLDDFIRHGSGQDIYLGVNNLHHLEAVRTWEYYAYVYSFIDFFFYLANAAAVRFVQTQLSKTAFGYYWIEGTEEDRVALERETGLPLFGTGPSFRPPYFIHAGDFFRESIMPRPGEKQPDDHDILRYDSFSFEVVVRDGYSYFFTQNGPPRKKTVSVP